MLPIDERLRAVALGQSSRLAQYEIEVESPLRPKEIQARIRAGETVEEIADAAGIAVERVRWFEGPVLAERAYMADQAQKASVRRHGDSTPGPRLGEIVAERMNAIGADADEAQWDAKKRGDGSWQVELTFTSGGHLHVADWVFDPRRRHVLPADDNAARMSLPGAEPPSAHGTAAGRSDRHPVGPAARQRPARTAGARAAGDGRARTARRRSPPAPVPPVPPVPSVPVTAEPARDLSHAPAAERNSWPPPPSREPAPAPGGARTRARRTRARERGDNHRAAPRPAEAAAEPPTCQPRQRARRVAPGGRGGRPGRAGRRAKRAPGPQGGARPAILGPVLGRDHVRQLAPAELSLGLPRRAGADLSQRTDRTLSGRAMG